MLAIDTGLQDLIAETVSSVGRHNPMTAALDSTPFRNVSFRLQTFGTSGLQVQPCVRFSADGVTWDAWGELDSLVTPSDGKPYAPATWGTTDLYDISPTTPKPYVQFGLYGESTTADDPRPFQEKLQVISEDAIDHETFTSAWTLVYATDTGHDFEVSPVLDATRYNEARASIEIESEAEEGGDLSVAILCFEVNKPLTPDDFSVDTAVKSGVTATYIGSEFTAISPDRRYIQFLARTARSGGTSGDMVMGRIRTRIDARSA